jgi:hypothetical protein
MRDSSAVVVTSIAPPTPILRALAAGAVDCGMHFLIIGDVASPPDFFIDGCEFYSMERQLRSEFRTTQLSPQRHYARKNIGYLQAICRKVTRIVETDDDNMPGAGFWTARERRQSVPVLQAAGWANAYHYFTPENIWPRGLPLDTIANQLPDWESVQVQKVDCPIQQGLVDDNPDVDAIYRLILPLPIRFRADRRIALGPGSWCPFNSQNTTWWRVAFPLLYLPAHCSFRMTDIWRSFIAQRIAWANDWCVLFHEATVYQARNDHNLMRDFVDEVPGYLQNRRIGEILGGLALPGGVDHIADNLRSCYEALVQTGILKREELTLLEAWLWDLEQIRDA